MLYTESRSKLIRKLDVGTYNPNGRSMIDLLILLCQHGLTLRNLMHMCTAASMRPSATMLKLALANSIPGLKNLPQEHVDPNFYLDIAKRYYSDINAVMEEQIRTQISDDGEGSYNACFENMIPPPPDAVQDPKNPVIFYTNHTWDVDTVLTHWCPITGIKKGREFMKKVLLEWREKFEEKHDISTVDFIKNLIWKLDNVHVFQYVMIHGDHHASIKEIGFIGFGKKIDDYVFDEHFLEPPIYRV